MPRRKGIHSRWTPRPGRVLATSETLGAGQGGLAAVKTFTYWWRCKAVCGTQKFWCGTLQVVCIPGTATKVSLQWDFESNKKLNVLSVRCHLLCEWHAIYDVIMRRSKTYIVYSIMPVTPKLLGNTTKNFFLA